MKFSRQNFQSFREIFFAKKSLDNTLLLHHVHTCIYNNNTLLIDNSFGYVCCLHYGMENGYGVSNILG